MKSVALPFFVGRIHRSPGCSLCTSEENTDVFTALIYSVGLERGEHCPRVLCHDCALTWSDLEEPIRALYAKLEPTLASAAQRWLLFHEDLALRAVSDHVPLPGSIWALLGDSRRALVFGCYFAAVVAASASVELTINTSVEFSNKPWRNLNHGLLSEAEKKGLPIELLLEANECDEAGKLVALRPTFVERRNKFAHGEASRSRSALITSQQLRNEASRQVTMAQNFVLKWAESASNPLIVAKSDGKAKAIRFHASSKALDLGFVNPWNRDDWL